MRLQSSRQDGTVIVSPSTVKPSSVSVLTMNSRGISVPSSALMRSGSRAIRVVSGAFPITSMVPSMTSPAPSSSTSSQARSTAGIVPRMSSPFSKRLEASVRMPREMAVWRMLGPEKLADSNTITEVSSVISLLKPPMTPAMPTGLSASAITSMSGVSGRSLPSRVCMTSPSRALRTTILPSCRQE